MRSITTYKKRQIESVKYKIKLLVNSQSKINKLSLVKFIL